MNHIQDISTLLILAALNCPSLAQAEPPSGHPSANQAMEILIPTSPSQTEELHHHGQVLSATNANQFTYLEVTGASGIQWIAVPLTVIQPGSHIRYGDGRVMDNFYSRLLRRTFPSITFVRNLTVVTER